MPKLMRAVPFLVVLLCASSSMAADFYLVGGQCKLTAGYLSDVKTSEQLRIVEGTPFFGRCTRISKTVQCDFINSETKEATPAIKLKVTLDSPPYLTLSFNDGAEFIAINLSNRHYVSITRIVDKQYLASKTCYGMYLTESELDALNK